MLLVSFVVIFDEHVTRTHRKEGTSIFNVLGVLARTAAVRLRLFPTGNPPAQQRGVSFDN